MRIRKLVLATVLALGLATQASAACVSNYHAAGGSYISSYNPDGTANVTAYESDYDASAYGGIALYNTSGTVLQVTTVPWMNFTLRPGQHVWLAFKDICYDPITKISGFAGHWDRGPSW